MTTEKPELPSQPAIAVLNDESDLKRMLVRRFTYPPMLTHVPSVTTYGASTTDWIRATEGMMIYYSTESACNPL
jgi:hypothetical protein